MQSGRRANKHKGPQCEPNLICIYRTQTPILLETHSIKRNGELKLNQRPKHVKSIKNDPLLSGRQKPNQRLLFFSASDLFLVRIREMAQQLAREGLVWPGRFPCMRGNDDIFFIAEMMEQQSEWKNGGGRANISSLLRSRCEDHIFRQKNTAGLLPSISVGDMYIETPWRGFYPDENLRSQTKFSSAEEEKKKCLA